MRPALVGTKVYDAFPIEDVVDYIDWNPFFQVRLGMRQGQRSLSLFSSCFYWLWVLAPHPAAAMPRHRTRLLRCPCTAPGCCDAATLRRGALTWGPDMCDWVLASCDRRRCGSCGAATPTAATPRSSTTTPSATRRASCLTRPRRCSRCGSSVLVLGPRLRQSTRGIARATAAPCRRRDALPHPIPGPGRRSWPSQRQERATMRG